MVTKLRFIVFAVNMWYNWGMDNETMLNVRIDGDVKRKFDAFCADTGMNASIWESNAGCTITRISPEPINNFV